MIKVHAKDAKGMQIKYLDMEFPKDQPVDNINEAYFERKALIDFLEKLDTEFVKVALALVTEHVANEKLKHNQLTMVMLGVNQGGQWIAQTEGLVSDMPCPPDCRHVSIKTKKIFTE